MHAASAIKAVKMTNVLIVIVLLGLSVDANVSQFVISGQSGIRKLLHNLEPPFSILLLSSNN